jgi:two-component sensor histidine kinase
MGSDEPFRDSEIYQSPLTKDLSSVALARLTLRAFLWDRHLDYLADTAQLIISELATNALKFGSGAGLTSIYLHDEDPDHGNLVIEVTDDSQDMPILSHASPNDEHNRGLVLVDQLASKWGVESLGDQKVVWAHLEYDDKTAHAINSPRRRHNPPTPLRYVMAPQ